jgi:hypothetical protein
VGYAFVFVFCYFRVVVIRIEFYLYKCVCFEDVISEGSNIVFYISIEFVFFVCFR